LNVIQASPPTKSALIRLKLSAELIAAEPTLE
jgi:hypothetical protein